MESIHNNKIAEQKTLSNLGIKTIDDLLYEFVKVHPEEFRAYKQYLRDLKTNFNIKLSDYIKNGELRNEISRLHKIHTDTKYDKDMNISKSYINFAYNMLNKDSKLILKYMTKYNSDLRSEKDEVKIPNRYEFSSFVQNEFLKAHPEIDEHVLGSALYSNDFAYDGVKMSAVEIIGSMYSDKVHARSAEDLINIKGLKTQIKLRKGINS